MPGPTTTRRHPRSRKSQLSPSPPKKRHAWGNDFGTGGSNVYVPRSTSSPVNAASAFIHDDDGRALKSLTEATILSRNKARTLADVTELNVWGSQLDDASILQLLPQLRIASLSVNKLTTLAPFLGLTNLEELYLRRNLVGIDLISPEATTHDRLAVLVHELAFLADCPKLSVLWLSENPISEWDPALYRVAVARILPQVKQLDNKPISTKERQLVQQLALDFLHADVAYANAVHSMPFHRGAVTSPPSTPRRTWHDASPRPTSAVHCAYHANTDHLHPASNNGDDCDASLAPRHKASPYRVSARTRSPPRHHHAAAAARPDPATDDHSAAVPWRRAGPSEKPSTSSPLRRRHRAGRDESADGPMVHELAHEGRDESADGPLLRKSVTTAQAGGRDESADGPMPESVARVYATAQARARIPAAWTIPAHDENVDAASVSSPGSPADRAAAVGDDHKTNVLFAVLALIRDLDPVALQIVKKEMDRMAK
ncbi:hypothetical protein AMAG_08230 [Allomyces macrogynus ATCC 38327]|uniref:U2A'/phosphoprotein 32 family A C-terminal domain-containing protein n=1 Tax=Allomyces macrogynus (strain ATCC 38327) TaxID=578462 RepID=A0A0L0SL10_ALLM3|nr:hypothetical protein AMAG_08230 [Allomyces macrogynus ATCC 38327]|eukprot:KNE63064.1 hypothetical protein AMAG_08230 [Allomyces macrogynus ATCC 38327]